MAKKAANWIDRHIGDRVREHRVELGISQGKLGEALGLTFQQIQKYENGTDRISARSLYEIAGALGVSVARFYEGLAGGEGAAQLRDSEQSAYLPGATPAQSRIVAQRFAALGDPRARQLVTDLLEMLSTREKSER